MWRLLIVSPIFACAGFQVMFLMPHVMRFDRASAEFNQASAEFDLAEARHDLVAMKLAHEKTILSHEKTDKALHNWGSWWSAEPPAQPDPAKGSK
jgi:hypothetical protein